jgi:hypothetical protein
MAVIPSPRADGLSGRPDALSGRRDALSGRPDGDDPRSGSADRPDRLDSFRIAAGSADELVGALDVAEVMGYLAAVDLAVPLALADRVLAMLFRLANPRR